MPDSFPGYHESQNDYEETPQELKLVLLLHDNTSGIRMAGLVYVPDMIMKREVLPIVPGIRAIFCNDEDSVF